MRFFSPSPLTVVVEVVRLPAVVTRRCIFRPATMRVQRTSTITRRIFWLMLKYGWFHLALRHPRSDVATLLDWDRHDFDICCFIYKDPIDDNVERVWTRYHRKLYRIIARLRFLLKLVSTQPLMQGLVLTDSFRFDSIRFVLFSLSPPFDCCSSFYSPLIVYPILSIGTTVGYGLPNGTNSFF
jgi:hypothetical protein